MNPPRIRTLKVRLIFSIFVIIISVYFLIALIGFLAYFSGLFNPQNIYHFGRFGILILLFSFFVISVITGILVFYRFNELFLVPINEVATALKQVEKGNYQVEVNTDVRIKEIKSLMKRFNRMAKEISSVELLKKDFISYFSHEFKTPIASIRGFSKQLVERDLPKEKQIEYAEIIYAESNRLIKMSGNVLTLTKLENQNIVSDKKLFSLDEQIRCSLLLLERAWEHKNIDLDLHLESIEINNNEHLIQQIWINVISNAINHSHQGGSIRIEAKQDGKYVKIKIIDEGIGMKDSVRERIFEKFYQGNNSNRLGGNGLGLPIVKRIIDLCKGKIVIKSQEGKGTTVIVYLPA